MADASAGTNKQSEGQPEKEQQLEEQRGTSGGCFNFFQPCSSWCRASREEEEKLSDPVIPFEPEDLVDRAGPLVAGIAALLIFRDGHGQKCLLKLNRLRSALLLLAGGRFGRRIPLEEIESLLSDEGLRRVDGFNADNTHCVAVSLVSGFAIPLLFRTEEDKNSFIDSLTPLLWGEEKALKHFFREIRTKLLKMKMVKSAERSNAGAGGAIYAVSEDCYGFGWQLLKALLRIQYEELNETQWRIVCWLRLSSSVLTCPGACTSVCWSVGAYFQLKNNTATVDERRRIAG